MVRLPFPGLGRGRTLLKSPPQHTDYKQVKQVSCERAGDQPRGKLQPKEPAKGRKPPPQPLQSVDPRVESQPDKTSPKSLSTRSSSPKSPASKSPPKKTSESRSRSQSRSPKSPSGRGPSPLVGMPRASSGHVGMVEMSSETPKPAARVPPLDLEKACSSSEHDTEELESAVEDMRIPCGSYVLGAVLAVVLAAAGWCSASAVAASLQRARAPEAREARDPYLDHGDQFPISTLAPLTFALGEPAGAASPGNASTTTTAEDASPGEASMPPATTTDANLSHAAVEGHVRKTTTASPAPSAETTAAAAEATNTTQRPTTRTTEATVVTTSTTKAVATQSFSTTTGYQSLLCFSVMQAGGYELSLARMQARNGVSIFACDEFTAFSDTRVLVVRKTPADVWTTVLGVNLHASVGLKSHLLNTDIFLKAWEDPSIQGRYADHDWTVKVDPDAVFFPDRLRAHMALTWAWDYPGAKSSGLYVRNCRPLADGLGLYGAIEVLSRTAVGALLAGRDRCPGAGELGEDLFMQRCLDRLDVKHVYDFGLIADAYCREDPSPCVARKVAFHPFKSTATYSTCLQEAGWAVAPEDVILK